MRTQPEARLCRHPAATVALIEGSDGAEVVEIVGAARGKRIAAVAHRDFDAWLKDEAGPEILKPAAKEALRQFTVSKRVNRTGIGDDDPTIVEPAAKMSAQA